MRDRLDPRRRGRGSRAGHEAWEVVRHDGNLWIRGEIATWLPADLAVGAELDGTPYVAEVAGDWDAAAALWGELGSPFARRWPWPGEARARGWPRRR